jgi:transcriptional regulator GlxA family with amidase domain
VDAGTVGENVNCMRISAKRAVASPSAVGTRLPGHAREIVFVLFDGAQLLDIAGPADVFSMANEFAGAPAYTVEFASVRGGMVTATSGLRCETVPLGRVAMSRIDTLIIVGGGRDGVAGAIRDEGLRQWVVKAARRVRRLAAVCSGSFALAHWGLLRARRATTHWSAAEVLRKHYPMVRVEADSLYVKDGNVWTSGGVTSGIDMSLAMVEADYGRWLATRIARQLVLTARRVGNQAQYSVELNAQAGRYAQLVDWIRGNIRRRLDLAMLAGRAGESARTFCRHFKAQTSVTPARFVEALRLQAARHRLEGGASVKAAARAAGFASAEHLSRVFKRRLAMSPLEYRRAHIGDR